MSDLWEDFDPNQVQLRWMTALYAAAGNVEQATILAEVAIDAAKLSEEEWRAKYRPRDDLPS